MTAAVRTPPSAQILTVARSLATAHPGAQLPCPVCAKSQRGDGLERHLVADHQAGPSAATGTVSVVTWTGVDRRVRGLALVPLILWIVGLGLVLFAYLQGYNPGVWPVYALGGWFVVVIVALVVANVGVLRATLSLDGDTLRLRHSLGLREQVVRLPATLESGRLRAAAKFDTGSDNSAIEVDFGPYLRLANGSSAIVVGCEGVHEPAQHWDPRGWQAGRPRKAWSITVDPASFVALEYALAGRRLLAPR